MKKIISIVMLLSILLLVGCNDQAALSDPEYTQGDSVLSDDPFDGSVDADNLSDQLTVDTTVPDTTEEAVVPGTTAPEDTQSEGSNWNAPDTQPPTEPTKPATPTEPDATQGADSDTSEEQTTQETTDLECTETDTTPINDAKPNTDPGWGPIV